MPGVHVLVQRCDEASLLVDNADAWVHIAKGLVLNVSFSKVATPADVDKASASLLSIPLMTVGQWGDRTKPAAITSLLQDGHEVNILVIPQASLVSKVRGKTLQYHEQIAFDQGRALFDQFVNGLRAPPASGGGGKQGKQGKQGKTAGGAASSSESSAAPVDPAVYFKTGQFEGAYAQFDARGVPTHTVAEAGTTEEKELSKSAKKKAEKYFKQVTAKWEKAQAKVQAQASAGGAEGAGNGGEGDGGGGDGGDGTQLEEEKQQTGSGEDAAKDGTILAAAVAGLAVDEGATTAAAAEGAPGGEGAVAPARVGGVPNVVPGTFGNRQGFRMTSAGPFTHTFVF